MIEPGKDQTSDYRLGIPGDYTALSLRGIFLVPLSLKSFFRAGNSGLMPQNRLVRVVISFSSKTLARPDPRFYHSDLSL